MDKVYSVFELNGKNMLIGGDGNSSEVDLDYKVKIFIDNVLQETQNTAIAKNQPQHNAGFEWSRENGYEKL